MTGAQIAQKLLPEIISCIDIENEEVWLNTQNHPLCVLQGARPIHDRVRGDFAQSSQNRRCQLFIGLQHENSTIT